jgi:hypothetical protein
MEISTEIPQKNLKLELPYDPAIPPTPGDIYLKECKSTYNSNIYTPMFIAALFTIAKLWISLDAHQ